MPELPEVHTTATMLNTLIVGKTIVDVWTDYKSRFHKGKKQIKDPVFFAHFKKHTVHGTITRVYRIGKNILIDLSNNQTILIHMKMTGHLLVGTYTDTQGVWHSTSRKALTEPINQYIHFVLSFHDGTHLALSDVRKFAKVSIHPTVSLPSIPDIRTLGPDPKSKQVTLLIFTERLQKKKHTPIKAALMDQRVFAGIGNIYSDEILWASDIHPLSAVDAIPTRYQEKMFTATKHILEKGVALKGDSTSDYRNPLGEAGSFHYHHRAYQKTNTRCSKKGCTGTIQRIVVRGRSAHFCPTHQKLYTKKI